MPDGFVPFSEWVKELKPTLSVETSVETRIKVMQCGFLTVEYIDHAGNCGNNGDTYTFELTTPGGQPIEVDGEPREKLTFSIVGNLELSEFFTAINTIAKILKR